MKHFAQTQLNPYLFTTLLWLTLFCSGISLAQAEDASTNPAVDTGTEEQPQPIKTTSETNPDDARDDSDSSLQSADEKPGLAQTVEDSTSPAVDIGTEEQPRSIKTTSEANPDDAQSDSHNGSNVGTQDISQDGSNGDVQDGTQVGSNGGTQDGTQDSSQDDYDTSFPLADEQPIEVQDGDADNQTTDDNPANIDVVVLETSTPEPDELRDQSIEEVVVTGSRIKGASETGILPVSVLRSEDIEVYGLEATGDILANLAQAGAFELNETADGPNDARGDISTVNLRGLGTGNTLILLNGRRYVTHPFTQDIDSTPRAVVNVNSIPASAIDRTEILKDGASSLYGADAAAGVVNLVLREDFEGSRINFRTTQYSRVGNGVNPNSLSLRYAGGFRFPNDSTHLNVFASLYTRDGVDASERTYATSVDKRPLLPDFWIYEGEGDTNFRNLSSLSPWGQFQVGGYDENGRFVGTDIGTETGAQGGFHIQPLDDDTEPSGMLINSGSDIQTNIDDDVIPSFLDSDLRYDFNETRQLNPNIDRYNLFTTLHHDFANGMSFFGELSWYNANTESQRAAQPIDVGLAFIIIPAQNYWNPFGPTTFSDGSANPNKIGGPETGSDVLITGWRPVDVGPRLIETNSLTLRGLAGVKGTFGNWDWESAYFYSYASAEDISGNRIGKTALFERLALSDPSAINPFGGPGFHSPSDFDSVRIHTTNKANSSITSWDFEATRSDLFHLAAERGAGLSLGVSWRNETYEDDRDPRLDGTIVYLDGVGGNRSDVAGVSPTADSRGARNVTSAYGELLVPIISDRIAAYRLSVQVALRLESFDDIDENIVKPKIALAWSPWSFMTIRGGYSQGFRAPNLVQLYRGDVGRLNRDLEDYWRAQANLSDASGSLYRRNIRISNPDLSAEDTETNFVSLLFDIPFGADGGVFFGTDLWNFRQENVISTFGALEQLALDFHLRQQGGFNPNVVRAEPTARDILAFINAGFSPDDTAGAVLYIRDQYINLDPRSVRGVDFILRLKLPESRAGRFNLRLEASRLLKFEQQNIALQPLLGNETIVNSATDLGEELRGLSENRRRLDGNPTWRSSGSLSWRLRRWGAAWSYNYVGNFFDTSAIHDTTGEFWLVKDWFTMNVHADYRFKFRGVDTFRVRIGVTNLTDRDPPLADQARGYYTTYHNSRGRRVNVSLLVNF